jgi:hypothetical protein
MEALRGTRANSSAASRLNYLACPCNLWRQIKTNNPNRFRVHKIRRCTCVVGAERSKCIDTRGRKATPCRIKALGQTADILRRSHCSIRFTMRQQPEVQAEKSR